MARARSVKRHAIYVAAAVLVGGCRLFDFDSCLYEIRAIEVAGTISDISGEVLYARVNIAEQRDYEDGKSMLWQLRGASLQGHVTAATLRDAADESKSLYAFPLSGGVTGDVSAGAVSEEIDGANLSGFFDVLAGGRAVVDVRTNIAGREQLRLVPTKVFQQDWTRPKCG